jgi:hypothetical protein
MVEIAVGTADEEIVMGLLCVPCASAVFEDGEMERWRDGEREFQIVITLSLSPYLSITPSLRLSDSPLLKTAEAQGTQRRRDHNCVTRSVSQSSYIATSCLLIRAARSA